MGQGFISDLTKYSIADIARMGYSFVATKLFYPGARLVRRPISIRQKKGFKYGKGLTTGKNCRIEIFGNGKITMGKDCLIGDNVHIVSSNSVRIGSGCLFASKIFISDTSHGSYGRDDPSPYLVRPNDRPLVSGCVSIGDNVWLGENVVVLSGADIGDGCVVGSNAVVTRPIPKGCIAVGSPAKPIKMFDEKANAWVPFRAD